MDGAISGAVKTSQQRLFFYSTSFPTHQQDPVLLFFFIYRDYFLTRLLIAFILTSFKITLFTLAAASFFVCL
jgi:hypothetical protein